VPLADVLYFKAELKYITVRTAQKSYILDGALNDLEERYGEHYLRIHRNTLVSKRAMRALERYVERAADRVDDPDEAGEGNGDVEGWAVRLRGVDDALLVSRRQLSAVRAAIAQTA
jgi:two-component system, LytTR family, response regulator AlgR